MATIPLKDITFPGLDNMYTIPEIDSTLSTAGKAADAKKTGDEIESLKTALTSDGVVPSAEQILSDKGITDSVPYHYRKTGGDGADRLYDQIVGGTVCFNQLVKNGNFADTSNWTSANATMTVSNNVLTVVKTQSDGYAVRQGFYIPAHKILKHIVFKGASGVSYAFNSELPNHVGTGSWEELNYISNITTAGNKYFIISTNETSDFVEFQVKDVMYFDLTQMFGATVADYIYSLETAHAGDGVAFFKALFPNDYYPYNAGELVSVSGLSEHKMVGFNQWDEEWEVGSINSNNGANYPSTNNIRSKNYTPVVCDSTYYIKAPNGVYIFGYDNNKNYVGRVPNSNAQLNTIFDVPVGVAYIRFYARDDYGTTYNHDICINLSDPAKNGTYEPYKAHSYPLDSTLTLRGLFKLDANNNLYADGDTYDADGAVTRKYGVVDLGTLDWVSENSDVSGLARADARNLGLVYYSTPVCSKFNGVMPKSYVNIGESEICFSNSESFPLIRVKWSDLSGKTNAEIKSALTGVMFVYELATPTTEEADPYQHLQQCDQNGTEEYVSTGIVPVGHNSFYPENLKAKIEGLPWNFANLIAPTESAFVATRNYVTGDLFIVSNVLYKATSNIANGGTITPNTNCTATTLAEIISALA